MAEALMYLFLYFYFCFRLVRRLHTVTFQDGTMTDHLDEDLLEGVTVVAIDVMTEGDIEVVMTERVVAAITEMTDDLLLTEMTEVAVEIGPVRHRDTVVRVVDTAAMMAIIEGITATTTETETETMTEETEIDIDIFNMFYHRFFCGKIFFDLKLTVPHFFLSFPRFGLFMVYDNIIPIESLTRIIFLSPLS